MNSKKAAHIGQRSVSAGSRWVGGAALAAAVLFTGADVALHSHEGSSVMATDLGWDSAPQSTASASDDLGWD
ncbi:hypothetical protein [Streptomyces sp. NPDC058193]|uniref:hypothetical protein n=1 Tax=Streptomyces sp. NPDC058193 TaxID=3346373 RepID=UPI0036E26F2D